MSRITTVPFAHDQRGWHVLCAPRDWWGILVALAIAESVQSPGGVLARLTGGQVVPNAWAARLARGWPAMVIELSVLLLALTTVAVAMEVRSTLLIPAFVGVSLAVAASTGLAGDDHPDREAPLVVQLVGLFLAVAVVPRRWHSASSTEQAFELVTVALGTSAPVVLALYGAAQTLLHAVTVAAGICVAIRLGATAILALEHRLAPEAATPSRTVILIPPGGILAIGPSERRAAGRRWRLRW